MEKTGEKGIFVRIYNWFKNLTVSGLLGAILVAFIIIIILLSASYLPSVMGRISSSFSAALYSVFVPATNATVSADKKIINSGEDFTVTFKKGDTTNTANGLFSVSYACDSNSNVTLVSVEGNGLKKINCDTPYYLLENQTSIKIRPTTTDSVVRLVLTGAFESNDTQKIENVGVVRMTITNDSIGVVTPATTTATTTPTSTGSNTFSYNPPASQSAYYGKPDLAVRILQVGRLNSATNLITTQSQFLSSDMVGIKFEVRNDGDADTGIWYFTATLPSISTPTYNSSAQVSLRPGESIIFTLGFSNLMSQQLGTITINVDPQNLVYESVEYNNITTSTITNLNYNSNYYNNNNYNNSTTGCYVNGVFTYNCYNNNNYNSNGYYDSYGNFISYNNNNYNSNGYYDSYGNFISYNNYNNYNYNSNNNTLGVTCYGSPTNPSTGDRVHWYANAFGGDGDYNYSWSGDNGLTSSSQNPSKTYSSTGLKEAIVTVESNGYYVSHTCSVYVNN